MAYVALGKVIPELFTVFSDVYDLINEDNCIENEWLQNKIFVNCVLK